MMSDFTIKDMLAMQQTLQKNIERQMENDLLRSRQAQIVMAAR